MQVFIVCDVFFILSVLLYLAASCFYIRRPHRLTTDFQMLSVTLLFFLFWAEQLIFCRSPIIDYPAGITAGCCFAVSAFLILSACGKRVAGRIRELLLSCGRKLLPLAAAAAVTTSLYISRFGLWFKGDSDTYLRSFVSNWDTWDLTPNTFGAFMLAGHITGAYNFLLYLVSYPLRAFGVSYGMCVRITGVFMMIMLLAAFYAVILRITPKTGEVKATILLILLAVSPSFFGTSYLMDSDFPQTVFLMLFLMAYCYELKVFEYLFAAALCFTKETAVILLLGIYIGGWVFKIRNDRSKGLLKKTFSYFMDGSCYTFAAGLFIVPLILGKDGWSKTLKGMIKSVLGMSGDKIPTPDHVDKTAFKIIKLGGLFVSHYNWIITLIILAGIVWLLILRGDKKQSNPALSRFLPALTGCFVMFILFTVFYFTYPHYRYYKSGYLLLILYLAVIMEQIRLKEVIKDVVLAAVSIMVAVECFHTTDPLTRAVFSEVCCGNGSEVTMTRYFYGGEYYRYGFVEDETQVKRLLLSDGFEHNLAVSGLQDVFEDAFKHIDPDERTLIVLDPAGGELATTTMELFGTRRYEEFFWDEDGALLNHDGIGVPVTFASGWTPADATEGQPDLPIFMEDYDRTCSIEQNFDRIYYIDMPFNDTYQDSYLDGRDIIESVKICEGIWEIDLIRLR